MKTIILTITFLTSLTLFGQEMDSIKKKEMDEMMREMKMRQNFLQPKNIESFSNYFKPELIDTFFTYIQKNEYDKLYDDSDDILKEMQPKEDLIKYFNAIEKLYGRLKNYKNEKYTIREQFTSTTKVAEAVYKVEFEKVKAKVETSFNVIDSVTIKIQGFQVETNDYTEIEEFDKLTNPAFQYLISKDYPSLYNSTSKRFQAYTPIAKYEEFTSKLDTVNFKKHKLFKNQIGVIKGQLLYYLTYETNDDKGLLTLTYTETDGQSLLEGINYQPKK